jgi:hypothetical protein
MTLSEVLVVALLLQHENAFGASGGVVERLFVSHVLSETGTKRQRERRVCYPVPPFTALADAPLP